MEPGPLPPHERTWRHPSELAAEQRALVRAEAAAPSTRVFALTTGTLGLLAVGILILTVTPRRQESPIALSATTTPVAPTAAVIVDQVAPRAAAALSATPPTRVVETAAVSTIVASDRVAALATPIGDGNIAVVTSAALGEVDDRSVVVRFASGATGSGVVMAVGDTIGVVALDTPADGREIAAAAPAPDDLVTVMTDPPVEVSFGDVGELDVGEGTAVVDDEGALVGLCHDGDAGVTLLDVTVALAGATTSVP